MVATSDYCSLASLRFDTPIALLFQKEYLQVKTLAVLRHHVICTILVELCDAEIVVSVLVARAHAIDYS